MSTTGPEARSPARLRLGTCPDSWGVWFADDPPIAQRTYDYLRGLGIGVD